MMRLFRRIHGGYITTLDVLLDDSRLTKWQVFKMFLANDSLAATFCVVTAPAHTNIQQQLIFSLRPLIPANETDVHLHNPNVAHKGELGDPGLPPPPCFLIATC